MRLSAYEWEVLRDIVCNTGQDKFDNSYMVMARICDQVAKEWYEAMKKEGLSIVTDSARSKQPA